MPTLVTILKTQSFVKNTHRSFVITFLNSEVIVPLYRGFAVWSYIIKCDVTEYYHGLLAAV